MNIFERMTVEVPTNRYDELVRKENKYEQYKWILEKVSPEHVALIEATDFEEAACSIIDPAVVGERIEQLEKRINDHCENCGECNCKECGEIDNG